MFHFVSIFYNFYISTLYSCIWFFTVALLPRTLTTRSAKGTKLFHGTQNVINAEIRFFSKTEKRIDTYMNYTRPPLAIGLEPIRKAFLHAKRRGISL